MPHTLEKMHKNCCDRWGIVIPYSDKHFYCVNCNKRHYWALNILYKISINYCSIKMQILIILSKILSTALSEVSSVSILQFSEHFQLIYDSTNVNNDKKNKTKTCFLQTFQNYKICLPYPSKQIHFGIKSYCY